MKRLRGVTLIELLVVVAIAALLLSIITPSLKIVKERAGLIKCANNQHQIVLAVSGYASEWGGRLPQPVTATGTPDVLWRTQDIEDDKDVMDAYSSIGSFLESSEVYNCPLSSYAKNDYSLSGGSYQDHYKDPYNDNLDQLYCSYQLLWNYDSYNYNLTSGLDNGIPKAFMGASIKSKNKLLVCEAMIFTGAASNGMPLNSWASSHRFEGSSKIADSGFPYYFRDGKSSSEIDEDASLRQIRLNAGYIDGRVERYVAGDTYKAQVKTRQTTMLLPRNLK